MKPAQIEIDTEPATATETSTALVPAAPNHTVPARSPDAQRRYNIAGDVVFKASADLPEDQRRAVRWLHDYCAENNIAYQEVGQRLKKDDGGAYDGNTVYKILTGRHRAQFDRVTKSILDFKRLVEERATIKRLPFIQTRLAKKIFQVCEAALIYQKIAFVSSDGQVGKTTAAREYQRTHNHGQTIYARMPAGGSLRLFLEELANSFKGISLQDKTNVLKSRIISAFDENMLLIVDEVHQIFSARSMKVETIEFIREIHDRRKCGVVLIDTNVFPREIATGHHHQLLSQLDRRSLVKLQLPTRPSVPDLESIAAGYKLPKATGEALKLQTDIVRDHGLGVWCTYLQAASRRAEKKQKSMSWAHVIEAHEFIQNLSDPKLN